MALSEIEIRKVDNEGVKLIPNWINPWAEQNSNPEINGDLID